MIELNTQNQLKKNVWNNLRTDVDVNVSVYVSNKVYICALNSVRDDIKAIVYKDLRNHTKLTYFSDFREISF